MLVVLEPINGSLLSKVGVGRDHSGGGINHDCLKKIQAMNIIALKAFIEFKMRLSVNENKLFSLTISSQVIWA